MDQPEIVMDSLRNSLGMQVTKYRVLYQGFTEGEFGRREYAELFAAALLERLAAQPAPETVPQ